MPALITIIGLGPGSPDALSLGALRALRRLQDSAAPIFARTLRHPTVDWLENSESIRFTGSFDRLYDQSDSFEKVYLAIVDELLDSAEKNAQIGYAVPGHPSFGEHSVELLRRRAEERGFTTEIIASASYLDAVLEAYPDSATPFQVIDALDVIRATPHFAPEPELLNPKALNVIYQVYDRQIASDVKLGLLEIYPPNAKVTIVTAAGVPGQEQRTDRELAVLDHVGVEFNHLTTLLLPPLKHIEEFHGYVGLLAIMARLRDPHGGCPWDREQTPQKLRRYLLEEAYEVLEAMDSGDPDKYAEELGDLLLQVVFHAQLARESGSFTMRDIITAITSKLVRRHPHVFGEVEADIADQVLTNWAAIKRTEKGYEDRKSILDGVPRAMPALMRAQEISRRAAKVGFEWDSIEGVFDKLSEEVGEFKAAILLGDAAHISDELGDLLFTVVNLARFQKVEAEDALSVMVDRFSKRFRRIEEFAAEQNKEVSNLSLSEMERVWQAAKGE